MPDIGVYNVEVSEDNHKEIIVTSESISAEQLGELAAERFGDMGKAVVDVNRRVLALGGGMYSDEEAVLLEQGSAQFDLWGINIYPDKPRSDWIEFDPVINIRPRLGNRSRGVEDPEIRKRIQEIVDSLVQ